MSVVEDYKGEVFIKYPEHFNYDDAQTEDQNDERKCNYRTLKDLTNRTEVDLFVNELVAV